MNISEFETKRGKAQGPISNAYKGLSYVLATLIIKAGKITDTKLIKTTNNVNRNTILESKEPEILLVNDSSKIGNET